MSYVFFTGGREGPTVWSPTSRVGALYIGMINVAAQVFTTPTGVRAIADDLHEIDPDRFEIFVRKLLEIYMHSSHPELLLLMHGVLPPSTVLLERCGVPLLARNDKEKALIEEGEALSLVW